MANDFTAIGSALYSALGGGTASPSVYYAMAPQGSTPPYTIFQRMAGNDEYTFNDGGVNTEYMIKVISNRQWPGEAWNAYGSVHTAIQGASLSVTGFSSLRCERRTTIEFVDYDRFWHVGGIYRVEAWSS